MPVHELIYTYKLSLLFSFSCIAMHNLAVPASQNHVGTRRESSPETATHLLSVLVQDFGGCQSTAQTIGAVLSYLFQVAEW